MNYAMPIWVRALRKLDSRTRPRRREAARQDFSTPQPPAERGSTAVSRQRGNHGPIRDQRPTALINNHQSVPLSLATEDKSWSIEIGRRRCATSRPRCFGVLARSSADRGLHDLRRCQSMSRMRAQNDRATRIESGRAFLTEHDRPDRHR